VEDLNKAEIELIFLEELAVTGRGWRFEKVLDSHRNQNWAFREYRFG